MNLIVFYRKVSSSLDVLTAVKGVIACLSTVVVSCNYHNRTLVDIRIRSLVAEFMNRKVQGDVLRSRCLSAYTLSLTLRHIYMPRLN